MSLRNNCRTLQARLLPSAYPARGTRSNQQACKFRASSRFSQAGIALACSFDCNFLRHRNPFAETKICGERILWRCTRLILFMVASVQLRHSEGFR